MIGVLDIVMRLSILSEYSARIAYNRRIVDDNESFPETPVPTLIPNYNTPQLCRILDNWTGGVRLLDKQRNNTFLLYNILTHKSKNSVGY